MHACRMTTIRKSHSIVAPFFRHTNLTSSSPTLSQRTRQFGVQGQIRQYAVPVNKQSSVDPLLGIAPPPAPKPIEEKSQELGGGRRNPEEDALPNFMVGTARQNNPNDLSELLRGNKVFKTGPGQHNKNRLANATGSMRRGPGLTIPTHDLENAFVPPSGTLTEETQPQSLQRIEVEVDGPKEPVDREHPHAIDAIYGRNDLDERILAAARALHHAKNQSTTNSVLNASSLSSLLHSFEENSERTLSIELPNESRPKDDRRVRVTSALSNKDELEQMKEDGVLLIAYVTGLDAGRGQERISVCSGFAIEGGDRLEEGEGKGRGSLVVSCAHTLRGSIAQPASPNQEDSSIALAITRTGHVFPIAGLLSSLPSSDLILLQLGEQAITVDKNSDFGVPLRPSNVTVRTLPINPYPATVGTELCVSSFWGWEDDAGSTLPAFEFHVPGNSNNAGTSSGTQSSGTEGSELISLHSATSALVISPVPPPPPLGREKEIVERERDDAGRSRWGRARLVEYRDKMGKEAKTGTYDELAQMDFKLLADNVHNPPALQQASSKASLTSFPPPGSSGGPIVDSQGAVVGIIRGTKMGVLEGRRGDGVPAEKLFFMFALPGFGKQKK